MIDANKLKIGDISNDGKVTIVDEDRLCYLVRSVNNGASGIRTISKSLLSEFIDYFSKKPDAAANDARAELCGHSDIDKFEYGYNSTLRIMALMALGKISVTSVPSNYKPKQQDITSRQQIFYGAPGTGKSHKIKGDESVKAADEKKLVFRTTFHPDSDYSTFVGTYKPTMAKKAVRNVAGDIVQKDKVDVYEDCITYSFVPQAFLQAYVAAWNNPDDKVFLVIEEINRGNCAQIFGDLFQLLDRDRNGWSEYPIMADKDLVKYLKGKDEAGCHVLNNEDGIKDGKLCLPNNLYIWATMNTSDQSLFPIDSAFKRRWDWKYVPIKNHADKNFKIKFNYEVENKDEEGNVTFPTATYEQDWWEFIKAVNARIESATHSEDKQLGYFFCDPNNGKIDGSMFVGKVIFYLWNDVFKNTGSKSIFNINSKKVSFTDFYLTDEAAIKRQEKNNPDGLNLELVKDFIEEIIKNKEQ